MLSKKTRNALDKVRYASLLSPDMPWNNLYSLLHEFRIQAKELTALRGMSREVMWLFVSTGVYNLPDGEVARTGFDRWLDNHVNYYRSCSEAEAKAQSSTNIDCLGCIDCKNCVRCHACLNCTACTACDGCIECVSCNNCVGGVGGVDRADRRGASFGGVI